MNKFKTVFLIIFIIIIGIGLYQYSIAKSNQNISNLTDYPNMQQDEGGVNGSPYPLSIEALRQESANWARASEVTIEQTLPSGSNYKRFLASYQSEGLKIYALLTIPEGSPPEGGWPAIIFNHGYIPPLQYQTTERYVAYVDGFARNGFIVFKPDYRGHGNSQGQAIGAYGSNAYTIDVLSAVSSIKKLKGVNPDKIGMWGHSLGGFITLRSMVVNKDIKAGVIWAGVVGSYPDLLNNWRRRSSFTPPPLPTGARRWRQILIEQFGEPNQNPQFWNSISANFFLNDISGPLQLHHGTADTSVPIEFSQKLYDQLISLGKEAELYSYPGDDHNLSNNFNTAMQRLVEFFEKYLKE